MTLLPATLLGRLLLGAATASVATTATFAAVQLRTPDPQPPAVVPAAEDTTGHDSGRPTPTPAGPRSDIADGGAPSVAEPEPTPVAETPVDPQPPANRPAPVDTPRRIAPPAAPPTTTAPQPGPGDDTPPPPLPEPYVPPAPDGPVPGPELAGFTDIANSDAREAIVALAAAGIVNSADGAKFNPAGNIQRQDFAVIMAKALDLDVSSAPSTATFSDIPTTHYSYRYVEATERAGLVGGTGGGKFGLGTPVTREEMAVIVARGFELAPAAPDTSPPFGDDAPDWAQGSIAKLVGAGIISSGGCFRPADTLERGDFAMIVARAMELPLPESSPRPSTAC